MSESDSSRKAVSHNVHMITTVLADVTALTAADRAYGDSWKRRGGVGAFMMLARKWDRIENIMSQAQCCKTTTPMSPGSAAPYDIFQQLDFNAGQVADDIRDLRRYLLLVEREMRETGKMPVEEFSYEDLENTRSDIVEILSTGEHCLDAEDCPNASTLHPQ